MPIQIDGMECLNTTESRRYLGWSFTTFKKYTKEIEPIPVPGKHDIYYRKSDLDRLRPHVNEPLEKRLADVARSVLRNTPMNELAPEWQELKRLVEVEDDKRARGEN